MVGFLVGMRFGHECKDKTERRAAIFKNGSTLTKKATHSNKHGRLVAVQDITISGIAGALKMEGG